MNPNATLEGLLRQHVANVMVRQCLSAIDAQTVVNYKATGPVPIHEIRDIYRRRAELNRKRHGTVEGFDELIPALDAEGDAELVVHAIDTQKEGFTIFTDVPVTRLIGLLISHLK